MNEFKKVRYYGKAREDYETLRNQVWDTIKKEKGKKFIILGGPNTGEKLSFSCDGFFISFVKIATAETHIQAEITNEAGKEIWDFIKTTGLFKVMTPATKWIEDVLNNKRLSPGKILQMLFLFAVIEKRSDVVESNIQYVLDENQTFSEVDEILGTGTRFHDMAMRIFRLKDKGGKGAKFSKRETVSDLPGFDAGTLYNFYLDHKDEFRYPMQDE